MLLARIRCLLDRSCPSRYTIELFSLQSALPASSPPELPPNVPSSFPMMKPASDKNFRCNDCQRWFTRIDHLKRHHLRHSGVKPYSCIFCSEAFARCDNLRYHYIECPERGDQPIPETGQRGRRRHACASCTSMKLRCDGQSPCSSCTKRKLQCNIAVSPTKPKIESPKPTETRNEELELSDRGSIRFLLNGGTDSFTERFRLPPRSDRARGMQYHVQKELEEATHAPNLKAGFSSDFDDLTSFEESFMSLITGPFPEPQRSIADRFPVKSAADAVAFPDPTRGVPGGSSFYESENPFSKALVQAILAKAWTISTDASTQQEISSNLHFLLTTRRIHKFISLYFQYWHRNCNIIHVPSFSLEQDSMPLLASVIFMGAMYSNDEREAFAARRMLDFAELYVFSADIFSCEHEISRTFTGRPTTDTEQTDWRYLQSLQAAFVMVVTQYWAGSKISRNRAMEVRYNEIIGTARRMGLTKCRHLLEDSSHETLWIQRECRVRTINIIALVDCAFSFYSNFPCRLTPAELECDLPCEDSVFASKHPFSHPNFRFTRNTTVYEAFRYLFQNGQAATSSGKDNHNIRNQQGEQSSLGMSFTVTDMFFLIHLLYSYISSHMTLMAPILSFKPNDATHGSSSRSSSSQQPSFPDDPVVVSIRKALSRWRTLWVDLRTRIPADEWAAIGFYKTAYNFWQVANLLITQKHSVDVIMQMEVKCEDKLEKLKVLLQDDND